MVYRWAKRGKGGATFPPACGVGRGSSPGRDGFVGRGPGGGQVLPSREAWRLLRDGSRRPSLLPQWVPHLERPFLRRLRAFPQGHGRDRANPGHRGRPSLRVRRLRQSHSRGQPGRPLADHRSFGKRRQAPGQGGQRPCLRPGSRPRHPIRSAFRRPCRPRPWRRSLSLLAEAECPSGPLRGRARHRRGIPLRARAATDREVSRQHAHPPRTNPQPLVPPQDQHHLTGCPKRRCLPTFARRQRHEGGGRRRRRRWRRELS